MNYICMDCEQKFSIEPGDWKKHPRCDVILTEAEFCDMIIDKALKEKEIPENTELDCFVDGDVCRVNSISDWEVAKTWLFDFGGMEITQ